ncbi:MAG: alpha-amylase [Sphaerochaeta sp.]|nr:alpha-amylase [Sphaerochaeta sp.]
MREEELRRHVYRNLREIYGSEEASLWLDAFSSLLLKYRELLGPRETPQDSRLDQHTCVLITYADSIIDEEHRPTLSVLHTFLKNHVGPSISTIHLLPFYPSSSDDGFSVVDPAAVSPPFGTWDDIRRLQEEYHLMFDFVVNHLSRSNAWIKGFLEDVLEYKDFAIEMDGDEDLRYVFRPRALPLLTKIGDKLVWTTFSSDQVDLNYHNPKVLLSMTEVLLSYVHKGASIVRLDAVAFLWKEFGTSCLHHPKTHAIVRFFAWVLSALSPESFLVTETNVPHRENISYFGSGYDEATMVYNFPLPPLVYHTFLSQDATALSAWAKTLFLPSKEVTFFNFLASHDGIGLMPVKDILNKDEIEAMASHTLKEGGFVSRKSEMDGSTSAYELNINYFSALCHIIKDESDALAVSRFVAASAIMIFFKGIPGIYIHSLIGSKNWFGDTSLQEHPRRINREKIIMQELEDELSDPQSLRFSVFSRMLALLEIRKREVSFSPLADQRVVETDKAGCFAFLRSFIQEENAEHKHAEKKPEKQTDTKGKTVEEVLVVINISAKAQEFPSAWWTSLVGTDCVDLQSNCTVPATEALILEPYQVVLLKRTIPWCKRKFEPPTI